MSPDEKLLAITDADWADRLKRSRQALASWRWEAKLPWADREITRTIAETEIGALRYFVPLLPDALQSNLAALLTTDDYGMAAGCWHRGARLR